MLYREIREEQQAAYNNNSIFWIIAAGEDDFKRQLAAEIKQRGIAESEVISIGAGGFTTADGLSQIKDAETRAQRRIQQEVIPNPSEIIKAFYYELCNYEFLYSQDDEEILKLFSLTPEQVNENEYLTDCYNEAKRKYFDSINKSEEALQ